MDNSKPFWASKTLWANIVALVAVLTASFGFDLGLDAETQTAVVAAIMTVVNIVMRLVTKGPVTLK